MLERGNQGASGGELGGIVGEVEGEGGLVSAAREAVLVVKADVQGTLEAICQALGGLSCGQVGLHSPLLSSQIPLNLHPLTPNPIANSPMSLIPTPTSKLQSSIESLNPLTLNPNPKTLNPKTLNP